MVLFTGYGPRWQQPKDPMFVETAMAKESCPVTRQLLGATTSNRGLYSPNAADAPLRLWLRHNGLDDGVPLGNGERRRPAWDGADGLAPLPLTVREAERQGVNEGDVGHTTFARHTADDARL